jgi:cytochrome c peroxidase
MKINLSRKILWIVVSLGAVLSIAPAISGIKQKNSLPPVPAGLPPVPTPANNPLTPAKAQLGEKLFFERGLSADHTISCANCHKPEHFFADPAALSTGIDSQLGDRNAVSILNAAYAPHLLWDGRSMSLEDQVRYPVTHPREMKNTQEGVVKFLANDSTYASLFKEAFGDPAITWDRVTKCIASFERTLLTGNSAFDRYMAGNEGALSDSAKRGYALFRGEAGCINCHTYTKESPFLSDYEFHNTGVGWAASPDLGRYEITKAREDKGGFRTPSLRNVAKTGPYMHDGRMTSLQEVVDYYAKGAEKNPFLDEKIHALNLTAENKTDLVAFLESLTGEVSYTAPANSDDKGQVNGKPAVPGSKKEDRKEEKRELSGVETDPAELLPQSHAPFGRVEVVAGSRDFGDGGPAIGALFVGVGGLAVDAAGNLYIADTGGNRVRKIDARSGTISTVAGNGLLTGVTDPKNATEQALHGPAPLALDSEGRYLFIGEIIGRRVQRVNLSTGVMEDMGAPPGGGFGKPGGLAWTTLGLLVADAPRGQVWKLGQDGQWTGLLPDAARMRGAIRSIAEDAFGRIYLVEYFTHRILRFDPSTGRVDVAAGTGEAGRVADGAKAQQSPLRTPDGIAFDPKGNLIVADKGNHRVCRIDEFNERMKTVVEAGRQGSQDRWTPGPIALGKDGVLWIGDIHLNRVLRYAPGAASPVVVAGNGIIGDGGPALTARLAHPGAVTTDARGNVYVSDTLHHRVRIIDAVSKRIRTVAGTGVPGYNGDGIAAKQAWLSYPGKLQIDGTGRLYIGDYYNNRVRRVDLRSGTISTIAGNGVAGEEGDDGPATKAPLINPHALLLEADKSLVIASAVSSKLRRVDLGRGQIHAVPLGSGVPDTLVFYGVTHWNGGLALASPRPGSIEFLKDGKLSRLLGKPDVVFPQDVAVSPQGELYICETGRNRVLKWDGSSLQVVVENLGRPRSISFDAQGNLLIADTFHNRVLRVWAQHPYQKPESKHANTASARKIGSPHSAAGKAE